MSRNGPSSSTGYRGKYALLRDTLLPGLRVTRGGDQQSLKTMLPELYAGNPSLLLAVEEANPELDVVHELERLRAVANASLGKRERRLARTLCGYYLRACSRPTPFGLFAYVTLATIDDEANEPGTAQPETFQVWARLAGEELDVSRTLFLDSVPDVGNLVTLNPSVYRRSTTLLMETRKQDLWFTVRLSLSAAAAAIVTQLEACDDPIPEDALVQAVAGRIGSAADTLRLVRALRKCGVLVAPAARSDLTVERADVAPFDRRPDNDGLPVQTLREQVQSGRAWQGTLGEFRAVRLQQRKQDLGTKASSRLHTVLYGTGPIGFPRDLEAPMLRAVGAINLLTPSHQDHLERFRTECLARYGERTVPLLELANSDLGVTGDLTSNDEGPLTGAVPEWMEECGSPTETATAGEGEVRNDAVRVLARLLADGCGENRRVELTPGLLEKSGLRQPYPLPPVFEVFLEILEVDGETSYVVRGFDGPGMRLSGRFAVGHGLLYDHLLELAAIESEFYRDGVVAEVLHVENPKLLNILARPSVRQHEIVGYGVRPRAKAKHQIPLRELDVCVSESEAETRLIWRRRDVRVIPRVTCAHNWWTAEAPAYRLLGELQKEGVAAAGAFSWGPLQDLGRTPRVRCGPLYIALSRWGLGSLPDGADRPDRVVRWLRQRMRAMRLPRYVTRAGMETSVIYDVLDDLATEMLAADIAQSSGQPVVLEEAVPSDQPLEEGVRIVRRQAVIPFARR